MCLFILFFRQMAAPLARKLLKNIAKVLGEYNRRVNTTELLVISHDVETSTTCKSTIYH
jgi:hypothetical protein